MAHKWKINIFHDLFYLERFLVAFHMPCFCFHTTKLWPLEASVQWVICNVKIDGVFELLNKNQLLLKKNIQFPFSKIGSSKYLNLKPTNH